MATSPLVTQLPEATVVAIAGWTRYVLAETKTLGPEHSVDERMAFALAGMELPGWLERGVRTALAGASG